MTSEFVVVEINIYYFGSCCKLFRMQKVTFVLLIATLLKLTLVHGEYTFRTVHLTPFFLDETNARL